MKESFFVLMSFVACGMVLVGCSAALEPTPEVPYTLEFNETDYYVGDTLFGRIVVQEDQLAVGTKVKKIDCRLANIVIGNVENGMVCPFGMRLKDTPVGTHTFSVIIKCEAPGCAETYRRYDYKMINIKEAEQ
ncbi:MAG: hypothetical protein K2J00_02430 [Bacteroidaceae bacterium]|nr:hypothetical protein [Bacteroidaceae bacterium]